MEADHRLGRLALGEALLGQLDAVDDGVADQVDRGIDQAVEHPAVDLAVLAPDLPLHILAGASGDLPDGAPKAWRKGADGDHPGAHGDVLELVQDPGEVAILADRVGIPEQLGPQHVPDREVGGGGFADEADQLVHPLDRDLQAPGVEARRLDGGRRRIRMGRSWNRPPLGRGRLRRVRFGRDRGRRREQWRVNRDRRPVDGTEGGFDPGHLGLVLDACQRAGDQPSETVDGLEQRIGEPRRGHPTAEPELLEEVFEPVAQVADLFQADQPRAALQGVRLAEDAVDGRRVARLRLQGQEAARHPLQPVPRLFDEERPELVL